MLQDALNSAAQSRVLLQRGAELGVGGVAEDDKRSLHVNHVHPMRRGAKGCYAWRLEAVEMKSDHAVCCYSVHVR